MDTAKLKEDHMTAVTIKSNLHGERTFRHVKSPTYRRRDGTEGGQKDAPRGRVVKPRDTSPKLSDLRVSKS